VMRCAYRAHDLLPDYTLGYQVAQFSVFVIPLCLRVARLEGEVELPTRFESAAAPAALRPRTLGICGRGDSFDFVPFDRFFPAEYNGQRGEP
jgi:hypothetical protein